MGSVGQSHVAHPLGLDLAIQTSGRPNLRIWRSKGSEVGRQVRRKHPAPPNAIALGGSVTKRAHCGPPIPSAQWCHHRNRTHKQSKGSAPHRQVLERPFHLCVCIAPTSRPALASRVGCDVPLAVSETPIPIAFESFLAGVRTAGNWQLGPFVVYCHLKRIRRARKEPSFEGGRRMPPLGATGVRACHDALQVSFPLRTESERRPGPRRGAYCLPNRGQGTGQPSPNQAGGSESQGKPDRNT